MTIDLDALEALLADRGTWMIDCACNAGGMCGCTRNEHGVVHREDGSLSGNNLNMRRYYEAEALPELIKRLRAVEAEYSEYAEAMERRLKRLRTQELIIASLESLLVCYRIGRRPSDKLLDILTAQKRLLASTKDGGERGS